MSLTALATALTATGRVTEATADEGFVHGDAVLAATGHDITLNVDPDPDEAGLAIDVEAMTAQALRLLDIPAAELDRIVEEVAGELTEALREEEIEQVVDLAEDFVPVALIAMPTGGGVVFLSPTQFPNGGITVVLSNDWEVEEIQLESMGDGGCEDCDCGDEHGSHGEASVTSLEELRSQLD